MNANRFRHVFSRVTGALVPVGEHAVAGRGRRRLRRIAAAVATLTVADFTCATDVTIPAGTLPVPVISSGNIAASGAATAAVNDATRTLTVEQSTLRAIIDWQSFNVGRDATVFFNHQLGAASSTLNRIGGNDPSVIQGAVRALGELYLVNPNGMVFKDGARVDAGSLTVSALRMQESAFNAGLLSLPTGANAQAAFAWDGTKVQYEATSIQIDAGAQLSASTGGRVMVFAPTIRNEGTVSAPQGQAMLAAGAKVFLSAPTDPTLRGFLVELDPYLERDSTGAPVAGSTVDGRVENLGRVLADRGNATLAGFAINQSGRVSATTTVTLNGSVFLQARDSVSTRNGVNAVTIGNVQNVLRGTRTGTVTFGPGSVTEVMPDLADSSTTQDAQGFTPSRIEVVGRNIVLRGSDGATAGSVLRAPGGIVNLTAQSDDLFQEAGDALVPGTRVFVGSGARIDVSGTEGVVLPVERNFIEVELRGNELRDSPVIRNGALRGQKVTVDIRKGTTLGDISGYLAQVSRGIGERTAAGGSISFRSEGEVVVLDGSTLDVSGKAITYAAGTGAESVLRASDGRTFAVSVAPKDISYGGFADRVDVRFQVPNQQDGVAIVETYRPAQRPGTTVVSTAQPGYAEGRSAGSIDVVAHRTVLEGRLLGNAAAGPYQRTAATVPLGGLLRLGDLSEAASTATDSKLRSLRIGPVTDRLPASFAWDAALPDAWLDITRLDGAELFERGGFTRLTANANGEITLGAPVKLAPFSALELTGRAIRVDHDITAPGGRLTLVTRAVSGESVSDRGRYLLSVGDGVTIDTAGRWTNDTQSAGTPTAAIVRGGGTVSFRSAGDVVLGAGSTIDVSAGAYQPATGAVQTGTAGAIVVASGRIGLGDADRQQSRVTLGGELRGFGFGSGGSLSVSTSRVEIGTASPSADVLALSADFFRTGGFSRFTLNGQDGLLVGGSTVIDVLPVTWVADGSLARQMTGRRLADIVASGVLPEELREATHLSLRSDSSAFGHVNIESGASVTVAPLGSIALDSGRRVTLLGALTARGGAISVSNALPGGTDVYEGDVSVWLGAASRIDATGVLRRTFDPRSLLLGTVQDGGRVSLSTGKGYLVVEAGAIVDVSGTVAQIDVPRTLPNGTLEYDRVAMPSAAGSVALSAREGVFLEGTLVGRPGSAVAAGGSLSVSMLGAPQLGFPGNARRIEISQGGVSLPSGLAPGAEIESASGATQTGAFNGRAMLRAGSLTEGGFDSVTLRARDVIAFSGEMDLAVRRAIELDAPLIAGAPGADVTLSAASVSLGHSDITRQIEGNPVAGDGTLAVSARVIDLVGRTTIGGFSDIRLASLGDIRLRGVVTDVNPDRDITTYRLTGALSVLADTLTLDAAQIVPSTLTEFTVRSLSSTVTDAGGTVTGAGRIVIAASAPSPAAPLTAGGALRIEANQIEQGGRLAAPFGDIRLVATDRIRTAGAVTSVESAGRVALLAGSSTSVSGRGLQIPFGRTELSGKDYVYALGSSFGNRVLTALPDKAVTIEGTDVTLAGRIDVSGGGELLAYEFVPGPGGSKDIFSSASFPNTFAILPVAVGAGYGPVDHQASLDLSGLRVGDQIRLSGANALGLAEGTYTLLPPGYAVVDGAFLVTAVDGYRDLSPGSEIMQTGGGVIVAGQKAAASMDGTSIAEARTRGFLVETPSAFRTRAEYTVTTASGFFAGSAGATLPGDAGRISLLSNGGELVFGGTIEGAAMPGRRGKSIDISAPRIRVASEGDAVMPGVLNLSVNTLNALQASSLLLGATRRTVDGVTVITPSAGSSSGIVVANRSDDPLTAADIMLVSGGSVVLADGASLNAEGTTSAGAVSIAGNGALVRVTQAREAGVSRTGFDRSAGDVTVGAGVRLGSSGSVILDATRDTTIAGDAVVTTAVTAVAAGTVSAGDVSAGTGGLVLGEGLLAQIGRGERLSVKSYGTLDLYGAVRIGTVDGNGVPVLDTLVLDTPAIRGFGSDAKSIVAGEVVLGNSSGAVTAASGTGTGALTLSARSRGDGTGARLVLASGEVAFTGFPTATLDAAREVRLAGDGTVRFSGASVDIVTARMAADDGATGSVQADGALALTRVDGSAAPATTSGLGATLTLVGTRVAIDTLIDLPTGTLQVRASGANGDDGVRLGSQAALVTAGRSIPFASGVSKASSGGAVRLETAAGNVSLGDGSRIDVSSGGAGASAGLIQIRSAGAMTLGGTLTGTASGHGGRLDIDVGVAPALGDVASAAGSGGFTEGIRVRTRAGDLVLAAEDTLRAREIHLSADAGAIRLAGTLDARGIQGGRIDAWASDDVALESTGRLLTSASSATGDGGDVFLGTTAGNVALAAGATLDVSGGARGAPGEIWLRAPRVGTNDVAVSSVAANVIGTDHLSIEAFRVYTGSTIGTTTASAVRIGDTGATATVFNQTRDYLAAARSVVQSRLGADAAVDVQLRPGIEVRSESTLALNSDWNFFCGTAATCTRDTALWNFDGDPGVLTLRAADDVSLARSLNDGFRLLPPATVNASTSSQVMNDAYVPRAGGGWSYRVTAGADTASADPRGVVEGLEADVVLANNRLVRTSTGFIDIGASRDVVLSNTRSAVYTAGEPGAAVAGFVTPNVPTASGLPRAHTPTYTHAGGDVRIAAGQDVRAEGSVQSVTEWLYRDARRSGSTLLENPQTTWWVRYDGFLQGFGAMGGGNVSVHAGRDVSNATVVTPTNGRLGGSTNTPPTAADFLELGGGDVEVTSGRDILGGLVLAQKGEARLIAGRDVASAQSLNDQPLNPLLALGDATLRVEAVGSVAIDGIFNPTIQRQPRGNIGTNGLATTYFLTYGDRSRVDIAAVTGDVALTNNTDLLQSLPNSPLSSFGSSGEAVAAVIYPATVSAASLGGDVRVDRAMYLAPAARGQLELLAAGDVRIAGTIGMSDVSPLALPGVLSRHGVAEGQASVVLRPDRVFREPTGSSRSVGILIVDAAEGALFHDPALLHAGDTEPVRIIARNGDVVGVPEASGTVQLSGVFPKKASIIAGRDVRDLWLIGQNLDRNDVTLVEAGRDVLFSPLRNSSGQQISNSARLEWGGPGEVQINAGRTIDLGNSLGLITKGNFNNPYLPESGAALRLSTGSLSPDYEGFLDTYLSEDVGRLAIHFAREARGFVLGRTGERVADGRSAAERLRVMPERSIAEFVDSVNYRAELTTYMRTRTGDVNLTTDQAVTAFRALDRAAQTAFVNLVLFSEIRTAVELAAAIAEVRSVAGGPAVISASPSAILASNPEFSSNPGFGSARVEFPGAEIRGYRALAMLYPAAEGSLAALEADNLVALIDYVGTSGVKPLLTALAAGAAPPAPPRALAFATAALDATQRYAGDVNLFFSQIKTEQGGDIELRVPGGLVNAGLATPGNLAKPSSDLGIVTIRGGSIQSAVLGDVQVNQSRVFTLGGGDIRLWSSYGNIDAGKGAKTASATPPPQIIIRDGKFVLDTSRSVEGSGIGVLLTREGIKPGRVDLIAPLGAVDAGDAGVVGPDITVITRRIDNIANFSADGGKISGNVPTPQLNVAAAGATNTDSQTSSAVARGAESSAQQSATKAMTRLPSFITVEVIGFGG